MDELTFQKIINGKDIWLSCLPMIATILTQSILYFKTAVQEARRLDITSRQIRAAMRSACVTAIGPSLSPVIIAVSMISIVGAPNAWFNLNNIGAARTELANVAIGASFAGVEELSSNIGISAWSYALWTCALNGTGWIVVTFLLNHRMEGITNRLYQRFEKGLVSALMASAVTSLFVYLLANSCVGQTPLHIVAAVVSAACMLLLTRLCAKNHILQELSLGISMLAGMFVSAALAKI